MQKYKCHDFAKNGRVGLPKKWRDEFGLVPGSYVSLHFNKERIFIRKAKLNSTDNCRLVTEEGAVNIPKEILKLMEIEPEDAYCLYVDSENKCFIFRIEE